MKLKTLKEAKLKNKRVLLHIDVNSPVVDGKILDNPRFKSSAETIRYLLKKGAKVAILAHQGRRGDRDFLDLHQHAKLLSKYSGNNVKYRDGLFDKSTIDTIYELQSGESILLENVRSYDDEISPKTEHRYKALCNHFDLFVNDAFSVCHREQGSIVFPPKYLPSYLGLGIQNEISTLNKFNLGRKKTIYLLGGAKVDDYLPIFNKLKNKRNKILASGVLANLLLVAKGHDLGYEKKWLKEKGYLNYLPQLTSLYKKHRHQVILPVDFAIDSNGRRTEISLHGFPIGSKILDVGHDTVKIFKSEIKKFRSIFMKGPLGFSEMDNFSYSTVEVLEEISLLSKNKKVFSLLGGGHLTTTIAKHKIPDTFSHISLSGGALIAYISGEKLPGLEALNQ